MNDIHLSPEERLNELRDYAHLVIWSSDLDPSVSKDLTEIRETVSDKYEDFIQSSPSRTQVAKATEIVEFALQFLMARGDTDKKKKEQFIKEKLAGEMSNHAVFAYYDEEKRSVILGVHAPDGFDLTTNEVVEYADGSFDYITRGVSFLKTDFLVFKK